MKKIFLASLFVVTVSGIIVAQKTKTNATADASNTTSAQKQGRQVYLLSETQMAQSCRALWMHVTPRSAIGSCSKPPRPSSRTARW